MKFSTSSAALVLAIAASVSAYPAATETQLSKRDASIIQGYIYNIQEYNDKRDLFTADEKVKRESQIVTDVLTAIKDTDLAATIIADLVTDPTFGPITSNTITALIKSGAINIETLLQALNDSGLAVSVIQDLINDCDFYAEIYALALQFIESLPSKISAALGKSKRELEAIQLEARSQSVTLVARASLSSSSTEQILTSLLESLKDSGLANQVVEELVTNQGFLQWGADLVKQLFQQKAISIPELIQDVEESGLVPTLIKAFLNLQTFNTVITNALAAAFGKCDGSSVTKSITPTTTVTPTGTGTSIPTQTGVCRKKKRSNY